MTVNYLEYMAIRVVMSAGERLCYLVLGDMSWNSFSRQSAEDLSSSSCSAAFRAEAFSSLGVYLRGNVATGAFKALRHHPRSSNSSPTNKQSRHDLVLMLTSSKTVGMIEGDWT